MTSQLQQSAAHYFEQQVGVSLDRLMEPIDALLPAGRSVRTTGVYNAIEKERRQDDASLPMGAWEHDLKRANWGNVSTLALDALQHQSKDMQLVAWLLEAQINLTGFAGISACLVLMDELCNRYWDQIHPQVEDGDYEYRANIIRWVSEKLLPALRLTPLVGVSGDNVYCWADWEQARRNEQLKSSADNKRDAPEGVTLQELGHGISATATDAYLWLHQTLEESLQAIEALTQTLDRQCGSEAPGMGGMNGLLQQILSFVDAELYKRGVRPALALTQEQLPMGQADEDETHMALAASHAEIQQQVQPQAQASYSADHANSAIRDRADAYARLAETAEFLMRLEPHSPVPYLVRRATEWGRLNTVELYQELFLKLGGQLNIFEMLGLESEPKTEQ
jgi:type VI secretion system protein ImpA